MFGDSVCLALFASCSTSRPKPMFLVGIEDRSMKEEGHMPALRQTVEGSFGSTAAKAKLRSDGMSIGLI